MLNQHGLVTRIGLGVASFCAKGEKSNRSESSFRPGGVEEAAAGPIEAMNSRRLPVLPTTLAAGAVRTPASGGSPGPLYTIMTTRTRKSRPRSTWTPTRASTSSATAKTGSAVVAGTGGPSANVRLTANSAAGTGCPSIAIPYTAGASPDAGKPRRFTSDAATIVRAAPVSIKAEASTG